MSQSTADTTLSIPEGIIAWDQLVSECEPRIAAWCRRFGLQNADAADVSQNVLMKMMLSLRSSRFDAKRGHLLCWLKVVTDNTIRSFLWKKKARRESRIDRETVEQQIYAGESDPARSQDNAADASEEEFLKAQLHIAEACVQPRVKPQTWEAYRLTMHENLSPTRTAEHIGISLREVYVAKCRVIGYLKRELGFESVSEPGRASRS